MLVLDYISQLLVFVGIYAILSTSLNLLTGFTGIVSIGHAAFFGLGAYASALMAVSLGTPFLVNLLAAGALAGLVGGIVGIPSLRIKDDYFIIGSFAFQVIAFSVFNNWTSLTGGPLGVTGIPQPKVLEWTIDTPEGFVGLTAILFGVVNWLVGRMVRSPLGRVLRTIREDEVLAESAGKDVRYFKLLTFAVSSSLASFAGTIYAYYVGFIDPTSFNLDISILIISMVIIGGAGSLAGPVVGAALLFLLPEGLRFLGVSRFAAANLRQIFYGLALMGFMTWRPQGLLGGYAFQRKADEL